MLKGDIIRKLREQNDWSQQQLADKINKSSSTVGMYEANQRDPDTETLSVLADLFGVTTDLLLGRINITQDEMVEIEALKKALVKAGYMKENEEDLTEEEFDRIMNFIKANKDFLKADK
jgi:transcriptional regulator with XRE-family HTH domain